MSYRQNKKTPLAQPLNSYPQSQALIDPRDYGALEERVDRLCNEVKELKEELSEIKDKNNIKKGWNAALLLVGTAILGILIWIVNSVKDFMLSH